MMKPAAVESFFATLAAANPQPVSELAYTSVFELLAAVLLSAQATDVSVNKATRRLFPIANTPQALLDLGEPAVAEHIKTIGLYRNKAKHLLQACRMLIDLHGGLAQVVLNVAFGEPTNAVDTHVFRVSNRTGLAPGKTPLAVELQLDQRVPRPFRRDAHHWLILHGRYVCTARSPQCGACSVRTWCDTGRALPATA